MIQLENAGLQRLCDAKDKLLEAREAEKQQLEEMLEQRLSDLGISPEQLYDNGTAEKQEMVCWCISKRNILINDSSFTSKPVA